MKSHYVLQVKFARKAVAGDQNSSGCHPIKCDKGSIKRFEWVWPKATQTQPSIAPIMADNSKPYPINLSLTVTVNL